jgi:hypothetical protein
LKLILARQTPVMSKDETSKYTILLQDAAGAEMLFRNGFSLAARFDGEFAEGTQKYAGTGRLRYTW